MRYFSMFSGIGGFELGIQQAYESLCNAHGSENRRSETDTQKKKGQRLFSSKGKDAGSEEGSISECTSNITYERPLCVGYSEIDKYAIQIYEKHFPTHKNFGDATKIDTGQLPDFELLVGGFPCQAFSIAGKRKGFDDTRGTLFFEIARILRDKQPRLFLLENVKGLLSHDNGKTFSTIISTLTELGYDLQWQVLNSKNFGVPQNRERVFIVGHLRGTSRPEVFPITGDNREVAKELKYVGGIIGKRDMWLKDGKQNSRNFSQGQRVYSTDGIGSTLAGNAGGLGGKTGLYAVAVDHGVVKEKIISNTLDANYYKGIDNHQARTGVMEGMKIRRLTPTECERLQGFPDGWTEGVSDTQRYKCLGNAVTVNVVKAIMERLLRNS